MGNASCRVPRHRDRSARLPWLSVLFALLPWLSVLFARLPWLAPMFVWRLVLSGCVVVAFPRSAPFFLFFFSDKKIVIIAGLGLLSDSRVRRNVDPLSHPLNAPT